MYNLFIEACKTGDTEEINRLSAGANSGNVEQGLMWACRFGKIHAIQKMIDFGAHDFNSAITWAGLGGHVEVINMLPILTIQEFYLNRSLFFACTRGHKNAVNRLLELGANDYEAGLRGACFHGKIDFAKQMIELGAKNLDESVNIALRNDKNLPIIEELLKLGAKFKPKTKKKKYEKLVLQKKTILSSFTELLNKDLAQIIENY